MDEDEERAFYAENMAMHEHHMGRPLRGMLTPAVTNTPDTPRLMAEAGLHYHADWVHDDQPVPLMVPKVGSSPCLTTTTLNDAPLWDGRPYSGEYLVDSVRAQFDQLLADSERWETGLVMCVALHPYQIGQPQHIERLRRMLDHICGDDRVWYTTADQIAEHYYSTAYDRHLAHTASNEPASRRRQCRAELRPATTIHTSGSGPEKHSTPPQHSGVAVVPVIVSKPTRTHCRTGPNSTTWAVVSTGTFPNISRVSTREYGHRVGHLPNAATPGRTRLCRPRLPSTR